MMPAYPEKGPFGVDCGLLLCMSVAHGGFGCTIRFVPWRWIANGFRAFDNLFYYRNSVRVYVRSTVGTQSEPFRMRFVQSEPFGVRFACFSGSLQRIQYKMREIGGQTAGNLGTCHHVYILTLKNKVVKRCSLTIFKVSGGWDVSVLPLYSSFSWQKSFQNLTFSELAILSTTLITQVINTNALISYDNRIKLTQSKST